MNTLPLELHGYICELSCIQDAATVRSLSMVSPYFTQVTRPYLYRNIAVLGAEQIFTLSSQLTAVPSHLRRIRHLFLSDTPNTPSLPDTQSQKLLRSIKQFVALSAPSLESLALFLRSPLSTAAIAAVFRTHFPSLRRLIIHGFYPYPSTPRKFPRLEHLHLSGNRNPHGLLQMCTLEDACPSLTSLRISGFVAASTFVTELEEALDIGGKGDEQLETNDCLTRAKFPPHLSRLVLQPEFPLDRGAVDTRGVSKDDVIMDHLQGIKRKKLGVELSILKQSSTSSWTDFRQEWLTSI